MDDRWLLQDPGHAVAWCRNRASTGIRCILARVEEYVRTPAETARLVTLQLEGIRACSGIPGVSFSVKPTSAGILADPDRFPGNLAALAREARERGVPLEIDMEGRPLVEKTLRAARALAPDSPGLVLALQAYLDRTPADLAECLRAGIRVRLVKGAYIGDTGDFGSTGERFRALAGSLIAAGVPFSAGTHDPEIIAWLEEKTMEHPDQVEFSFLKGLSDRTKLRLAAQGRRVAEYVPFGKGGDSYVLRRQRYLEMLERLERAPAP